MKAISVEEWLKKRASIEAKSMADMVPLVAKEVAKTVKPKTRKWVKHTFGEPLQKVIQKVT
jgi:hypothetical protein